LQTIALGSNRLTGQVPSSLSSLTSLTELMLGHNDLKSISLPFGNNTSPSLQVLDLRGNVNLGGVLPAGAWLLPQLQQLLLSRTQLRGDFPLPMVRTGAWTEHKVGTGRNILCPELALAEDNYMIEVSPEFSNYSWCRCRDGDAGIGGVKCWECPFGASCQNGSLMRTAPGYWCDAERYWLGLEIRNCALCAMGVCQCGGQQSCGLGEQCNGNRVGVLCGECPRKYSMALGSVSCLPEEEGCDGASWLVPTVVLSAGLFAGYRTLWFRKAVLREPLGLIDQLKASRGLLVFFFQIVPLVSVGLVSNLGSVGSVVDVMFGIFNLQVAEGNGEAVGGVCFAPGVTAVSRAGLNAMVPLLLLGWTFVFGAALYARSNLRPRETEHHRWQEGLIQGLLTALSLGYSTLLKVTFSLLQCVPVEARGYRLLINGNVECYMPWQQGLFVTLAGLTLFPVGLFLWLRKQISGPKFPGSAAEGLTQHLTSNRRLWPVVVFMERYILVLIGSFSPEERRPWILCFVLILLIAMHVAAKPYKAVSLRITDAVLLVVLLALCILSIAGTIFQVEQVPDAETKLIPFAVSALCLKLLSLVAVVVVALVWRPSPVNNVVLDVEPPFEMELQPVFEPELSSDLLLKLSVERQSDELVDAVLV